MPFLALHNDSRINSLEITDEGFESFRGSELLCIGCKSPMHIRYSKAPNRIRHFVHTAKTSHCFVSNMSQEHLGIPALVEMSINKVSGWTAQVEYQGEGWRGDVVAINQETGERISFEVQLSPMTEEKALERTERHLKSGINRVIWLCGKEFDWLREVPGVHFKCDKGWNPQTGLTVTYSALPDVDASYEWYFVDTELQLTAFVEKIVSKQLLARYDNLAALMEWTGRWKLRYFSAAPQWHFQTLDDVRTDKLRKAHLRLEESDRLQRYLPLKSNPS